MALVTVDGLSFAYPDGGAALRDVSLTIEPGEVVALLGPSGSGKSTLLRALAGLVPHFHGGRFAGRVVVDGHDTRTTRPAELAGVVATVFQDPEDQVVMTVVENELAFGLENLGVAPEAIWPTAATALAALGIEHLACRRTHELSGGELQRTCLAAALALNPRLLLLDEPTSQLDGDTAERFLELARGLGIAVVVSEQRVDRALSIADRVLFVDEGRVLLDAPRAEAVAWLRERRPRYAPGGDISAEAGLAPDREPLLRMRGVSFAYVDERPVLAGQDLTLAPGEIVVLEGPNGSGKTTLAKLAAGLLEPGSGTIERRGTVAYLSQDPGRYLVKETVVDEVALAVGGDRARATAMLDTFGLASVALRHPRDLSSGERERLAIAAVAVAEPELLVLDEPTRGVDPDRHAELAEWIVDRAATGTSVLLATHDRALPAHRRIQLAREAVVAV